RGILINITGSSSLKLAEVNEASTIIQNASHEDANIIFGAVQDEKMKDEVKITVIATGFKTEHPQRRQSGVSTAAAAISKARTSSSYVPQAVNSRVAPGVTQRETPALDAVRDSGRENVEHDDLDVPTFIRKRGESR
ncbi:MAG: cell division protein FtsZ, partial [Terriglobales bacterium]